MIAYLAGWLLHPRRSMEARKIRLWLDQVDDGEVRWCPGCEHYWNRADFLDEDSAGDGPAGEKEGK